MSKYLSALLCAAALIAGPAAAHDDATLDTFAAPHGGQLRMSGAYHLELVLARAGAADGVKPVEVYLTDHGGNKVASQGASGSVTLLGAGGKTRVALSAAGDNKLTGQGKYASEPGIKAVVTISLPDGSQAQARFTPLAPRAAGKPAH